MTETYTFATGRVVEIKRVSPFLVAEVHKSLPTPEPPLNRVVLVDGAGKEIVEHEPNPADPDYIRALAEHESLVRQKQMELVLKRGVVIPAEDLANVLEEIGHLRAEWLRDYGAPLSEPDDLLAYLKYICVGDGDDLGQLTGAILGRSQPTEAALAAASATFPGPIPGKAD